MNNRFLREIKSAYKYMSAVESKIADALLEDPEGISNISLWEFAAKASVSQGSIINFANKFCDGGFSRLKQLMRQGEPDGNDAHGQSLISVVKEMTEALLNTTAVNSEDKVFEAAEKLNIARKVEICGLYRSAAIATDFYFRLLELGVGASFVSDVLTCAVSASLLGEGDVLFAISTSGETKDIIDAVRLAKENGTYIISITANRNSPLAMISDLVFTAACSDSAPIGDSTQIRVAQLAITDAICSYLENMDDRAGRKPRIKELLKLHSVRE